MKSTVFVRPNLKMFVLGGVLLAALHHLITNGHSEGQGSSKPLPVKAREMTEDELQMLVRRATEAPSVEIYTRISRCYENRGEYKKALLFLRRAEKISQSEDNPD
jgi:hypothetical protein